MNLVDVLGLFGTAAPWLAAGLGLFLATVILMAFRQGRAVSLWPPRIGPRPDATTSRNGAAGHGATVEIAVDRQYTTSQARDFYQEIAPNYDLRNSGNLVSTHLATVAAIQAVRARHRSLRVLDLGGGTGKLIAIPFFNDDGVCWTYVDFCPAMAAEFRRNLAGYPLGGNAQVVVDDIGRAVRQLRPASYDVILLSLVLSSMPAAPDFGAIAGLLAPGGCLIVTDINPGYTRDNPLYKVAVGSELLALRTAPVDPFEVIRRATAAGLHPTEQKTIGEGCTYYSFMTVFSRSVARTVHESGDGTLVPAAPARNPAHQS